MKIFILLITFLLASCAFQSGDGSGGQKANTQKTNQMQVEPNTDSDGDKISDIDEISRGTNPNVADLPELKVRFLQNYKIEIIYHPKSGDPVKDQKTVEINTNIKDTNPDFKFRVGSVFARENALKTASSFGKFSSHSSGVFTEHDLSWIKYPDLDPRFFHNESVKNHWVLTEGYIIDNIRVTLSNQIRLSESPYFKEIKNLSVNFYYLNHESENYELLANTKIDKHFQSGIYESFDIVLENVPVNLIKDGFFKKGEFIISEIDDYEIPSLNLNYKTLISSIKAKSIPVLFETPIEDRLFYVAVNSGSSFQEILKNAFDKNFEVKDDKLVRIGQFQNNLSDFTHLKEIKDKDKFGKWFVMTNEFKENYLDRAYRPNDRIILSYITGADLSQQAQESFFSYGPWVTGDKSETIFSLGNISPNSKVDFTIHPVVRFGRDVKKLKDSISQTGGSCGKNCVSFPLHCAWEINTFSDYQETFNFNPDLSGEGLKLELVVNGESFKLFDLLKDKKIQVSKVEQGLHISIDDISKIKEIKEFEENSLSIKVKSFAGNDFFGVKLTEVGGIWQGYGGCAFNTPAVAEKYQTAISTDSRDYQETLYWGDLFNQKGWPYKLYSEPSGPYYQEIAVSISSSINNYFN